MSGLFDFEVEPALKGAFICGSGKAARMATVSADSTSFATARPEPPPGHRWLAGLLLAALAGVPAWAGGKDDHDHDRARAAVQAGEVLPLPVLLERLRYSHPGEIFEVELERDDSRWIYELKLLQADGRLVRLEVDARTAEVLEIRPTRKRRD